jgi:manganese efflux pump family protein
MSAWVLLGVAISLAMDASAVAIGTSIRLCKVSLAQTLRMSLAFGLFQFLMPVAGWYAGVSVAGYILRFDHWVAFGLLLTVGGHMLYEAFTRKPGAIEQDDPTRGVTLLVLAVATSIDALAVGLSFAFLEVRIWVPALVIGVVTALLTAISIQLGCRLGHAFGKRLDALGGLVLIAIGVKILIEHL